MLDAVVAILDVQTVVLVLSLLFPLSMFFAAFLLSMSIFARSYKEAQSMISPLMIVVILPVMIGLFPGVTLGPLTAMIPILNVSLATKEIIAGTVKTGLLLEVYASLILLAGLSLFGCARWFQREETIFRGCDICRDGDGSKFREERYYGEFWRCASNSVTLIVRQM